MVRKFDWNFDLIRVLKQRNILILTSKAVNIYTKYLGWIKIYFSIEYIGYIKIPFTPLIDLIHKNDFLPDNRSDNLSDNHTETFWDFLWEFSVQICADIFLEIIVTYLQMWWLSSCPITLSQMSTGSCVMYRHVHFSDRSVSRPAPSDTHIFQCAADALHPVNRLHFSVRDSMCYKLELNGFS